MSARIELEPVSWNSFEAMNENLTKTLGDTNVESFLRDFGSNAVIPLHEISAKETRRSGKDTSPAKRRASVTIQAQWGSWLVERDRLRTGIKRGEECLEQMRKELRKLRGDLEEWPDYERICGKNPLEDYMQSITAKERIAKFLPVWLKRQQAQLQTLKRKMGACAKQNRFEHLL
jgi:hypothetical protein